MYKILRFILFLFPAEWVHYFSMNCLKLACRIKPLKWMLGRYFQPANCQSYTEFNIDFPNRIGLGAGFDKNAKYLGELELLGFGFIEIGTVTPEPQTGNRKPRLFRLSRDRALINRMGFNNDGVKAVAERLKKWRSDKGRNSRIIVGGNIGKNKNTPNEEAWKDYETCFLELHPYVDYFVVNVSSPNTPGLRELQEKESLKKILFRLEMINNAKAKAKPILLKISPDLTTEQLDDVIDLAVEIRLDGLVAANTTVKREALSDPFRSRVQEPGGLSGKPLKNISTEITGYITRKTGGDLPVIASGGVFNAEDAREKFDAGASLVQVWTGFIYEGPRIVSRICGQLNNP